jgi:hypothetical protein
MTMGMPFSRMGQPIRIPVSASSASTEFPFTLPRNAETFMFWNPTNYDVRLEGYPAGNEFVGVTEKTGWPVPARSWSGPFRTKNPTRMSAAIFSSPGAPVDDGAASGQYIELIYGDGT